MICLKHNQQYSENEYCIYCGSPFKVVPSSSTSFRKFEEPVDRLKSMSDKELRDTWDLTNCAYQHKDYEFSQDLSKRTSHAQFHRVLNEMKRRKLY